MVKSKYRMTGFARFVIFLMFFIPVTYIGASYYNGEDGIAKIKAIFNMEQSTAETKLNSSGDCDALLQRKDREISRLKATIKRMDDR